jgi:CRISPR-associated protein Cmr4
MVTLLSHPSQEHPDMQTLNVFIYTETSLHAGTGSSVSVVDLPIQRERSTQYPLVQGSGVKGALRQQMNVNADDKLILFGSADTQNASEHAGALAVGDAQIVLFPVRSLVGVFAYVTCAHVLARIKRSATGLPALNATVKDGSALVTAKSSVTAEVNAVLEEFTFTATENSSVTSIAAWLADNALPAGEEYAYWRSKLKTSLIVLSDNDFRDFVVNSTEITTRVRLSPGTKTVEGGALWTEEALPSDTLLMSMVMVRNSRKKDHERDANDLAVIVGKALSGARIQIGGDETTGSGFVALRVPQQKEG